MNKYKEETIEKISNYLSNGLNSVEIAEITGLHEVTIRNIKSILKKRYTSK